jgi:GLPGLI family protein
MKIIQFQLFIYLAFINVTFSQSNNERVLLVKYDFSILRDTTDPTLQRFTDVMTLDILKSKTTFYSGLRHLGLKKSEESFKTSGNAIIVDVNNMPFRDKETETIVLNFETNKYKIFDRISRSPHYFEDSLVNPNWELWSDTIIILNELCQKATAFYKGRNIIAWFAKNIPLQQGPWLYNGLPGLIMKVEDTRNQFAFVCRELIAKPETEPVFIEYENAEKISKEIALKRKRLHIEDPIASSAKEWGVTMTYGDNKPRKKRPYNPLDLSN